MAVKLPDGCDLNEWLSENVVKFLNKTKDLYGLVCDCCTTESCPNMSGGTGYEYHWADGEKYKKPTPLPAPVYIGLLMDWAEALINDDSIFPSDVDVPFPKQFAATVKQIFKRLLRVFVHVYYHHYDEVKQIEADWHLNTCFEHFHYFVNEFELIDPKEQEPLKDLTKQLTLVETLGKGLWV